jgi:hypothetical protein
MSAAEPPNPFQRGLQLIEELERLISGQDWRAMGERTCRTHHAARQQPLKYSPQPLISRI